MPETIGQQLKAAREARNLTFAKVTQATHIQARLLEAMEADDFEKLPSPVQGRAFLRLYAGFLELSLDDMITRQRQVSGEPAPTSIPNESASTSIPNERASTSIPNEPAPTSFPEEPVTNQLLVLGEDGNELVIAGPAAEEQADRTSHFAEKIKGLLVRLRKLSQKSGQPSEPTEPTQLSLPFADPAPVPARQPGLVETPAEAPSLDWQDEQAPPAWRSSEQPESQRIFISIGQALRQRRESLSLTLDEIESHTHVRKHYLEALEQGDFNHLPSSVQTRGMVNNYAHFLDMDVDAILLQFADGLQAQRLERQPASVEKTRNEKAKMPPKTDLQTGMRRYLSMDILVGGGLILVLLAFAIWGTSRVINLHSAVTPQSTAQSISEILAGSSGTVTLTPTPSAAGMETILPTEGVTPIGTIPAAGPGPVQVTVVALQEAYLRVTVDGQSQFDGRISNGTAYSFSGNNQIEVLTGNGAGISILFNKGNLGPMGRFGEVVDRIYTATAILNPTATKTPTITITPTPTITPRVSPTPTLTITPLLPPAITP